MSFKSPNHPIVVWVACVLWIISIIAILWSLFLFFCVGDVLFLTGTDMVNALVLLSGVLMLPTNLYIIYAIAKGNTIDCNAKVICCRLWTCIIWNIIINAIGVIVCGQRMYSCQAITLKYISNSMKQYRTVPKHKHFIDNIQWSLGCCGLHSYKDWFTQDWHDKVRDYEWNPSYLRDAKSAKDKIEVDSVPLSCCKSGSCVSSYLKELGTYSVNTSGCGYLMYRIIMTSLSIHLFIFITVVVLEVIMVFLTVVNLLRVRGPDEFWRKRKIFRLAAHFIGRRRNCYSVAIRNVHHALTYATKARRLKKQDMKDLWETRITAACEQHNITAFSLREGLERSNIMLDRKSLSDLAAWEPKTFECLAAIASEKIHLDGFIDGTDKKAPTGNNLNRNNVFLKDWLKEKK